MRAHARAQGAGAPAARSLLMLCLSLKAAAGGQRERSPAFPFPRLPAPRSSPVFSFLPLPGGLKEKAGEGGSLWPRVHGRSRFPLRWSMGAGHDLTLGATESLLPLPKVSGSSFTTSTDRRFLGL